MTRMCPESPNPGKMQLGSDTVNSSLVQQHQELRHILFLVCLFFSTYSSSVTVELAAKEHFVHNKPHLYFTQTEACLQVKLSQCSSNLMDG